MWVQLSKLAIDYGPIALLGIGYVSLIWYLASKGLRYPDDSSGRQDRAFRLSILNEHKALIIYRRLVAKLLTVVDSLIQSRSGKWASPVRGWARSYIACRFSGKNPWDESCYSFCLSLAFIYPVFVIIIPWSLGASGVFVGHQLLPSDVHPALRFLVIVLICSSVLSGWLYATLDTARKKAVVLSLWAILVVLSVLLSFKVGFPLVLIIGIASNSILAAVHSGILSTVTVFVIMLFISGMVYLFGETSTAVIFAAAGFFFSGLNIFWDWFRVKQKNRKHPSVLWIVLWNISWSLLVFIALYLVSSNPQNFTGHTLLQLRSLLCVFVLLPLFNAPFDWLSLGLTRGLLIKIRDGEHDLRALMYGLLDLVIAALFWLATLLTTIALFSIANKVIGVSDFDVKGLLSKLGESPWDEDVMWVHLMAATTLIPTIIHFLVASFSVVNALSGIIRNKSISNLLTNWPANEEVKDDRLYLASLLLTLNAFIAILIPIVIVANFDKLVWAAEVFVKNSAQAIYILMM